MDHLNYKTNHRTSNVSAAAAQFAGLMTLRLVHDHLLHLDVGRYYGPITKSVLQIYKQVNQLTQVIFLMLEFDVILPNILYVFIHFI